MAIYYSKVNLMLDARLGYRNKGDAETDWKEYAKSFEARNLNCDIDEDKKIEGYHYNCSILLSSIWALSTTITTCSTSGALERFISVLRSLKS